MRGVLPALRAAFDALDRADPARASLARALGRAAEPQDVPRLAAALAGRPRRDWRTRVAAAGALGALRAAAGRARGPRRRLRGSEPARRRDGRGGARARRDALGRRHRGRGPSRHASRRPWQATAPLLPVLARAGRLDAVDAWAARQTDPFAQAAVLAAYGAASDAPSLDALFARARDADARLAAAAVEALRARWAATDSLAREPQADRYYAAFAAALSRRDLATTSAAAPVLSDSAFVARGSAELLRSVYGQMAAPEDIEPMVEIVNAARQDPRRPRGRVPGRRRADGPPGRCAPPPATALNERLVEGIDVSARGPDEATATTGIDWAYLARVGPHPRLVLDTDRGRVVIEMDAESAPQTVQTIAEAAASGRYDGVPFHRVVSNFVVQGGDFFRRDGYGGPAVPIRSEFTRLPLLTGAAGIASAGKDTEGVQFFVTHSPTAAPRRPLHGLRPRRRRPGRHGPPAPGRPDPPRAHRTLRAAALTPPGPSRAGGARRRRGGRTVRSGRRYATGASAPTGRRRTSVCGGTRAARGGERRRR